MAKCKKVKELSIQAEDRAGMLGEVADSIASGGVNIEAICGYGMEGKAYFMVVTNDSEKAKAQVSKKGWKVEEKEVVVAELENKIGAAGEMGRKLKAKNISLDYCYGSTSSSDKGECVSRMVLRGAKPDEIISALNQTDGHRAKAAYMLGISERTLYRHMKRLRDSIPG